jgi:hypothetical protein
MKCVCLSVCESSTRKPPTVWVPYEDLLLHIRYWCAVQPSKTRNITKIFYIYSFILYIFGLVSLLIKINKEKATVTLQKHTANCPWKSFPTNPIQTFAHLHYAMFTAQFKVSSSSKKKKGEQNYMRETERILKYVVFVCSMCQYYIHHFHPFYIWRHFSNLFICLFHVP